MKNTLTYSQGAQSLLANMNDGTNRILINGVEIPSSDWTGTGTFTYSVEGATISIQRIADTSGNIMLQKVATDSYRLVRKEESSWQTTTGDTKDNVTTFTSSDVADGQATDWTSVTPLASGEKHSSIFAKVSQMFKNIRFLYKMLGTTDISSLGDGSVTSAISALNVSLTNSPIIDSGRITSGTCVANNYSDFPITYSKPFSTTPRVFVQIVQANSIEYLFLRALASQTKTGCILRIQNTYSSAIEITSTRQIFWMAIET